MVRILFLSLISFSSVLQTLCDNTDGGKAPRIVLNDGNTMPVFGLGTFLGFDEKGQREVKENEVELPVLWALNSGYRLIDTASAYHNEEQVGRGVLRSNIPREHVFIVTKLGLNEQRHVIESLRASLQRLNTSYVDLYLIHNPVALKPDHSGFDVIDYLDTWKGMEEAKRLGLAKSIGISNFNNSQIERLLANCEIKPAVLQVEALARITYLFLDRIVMDLFMQQDEMSWMDSCKKTKTALAFVLLHELALDAYDIEVNLNLAQDRLLELTKREGIEVMAYSPFGSLFSKSTAPPPPRKDDPVLVNMAKKYGKTTPQITLRYLVQRGLIPIPKSVHKERVEENINIFDFELSTEEMDQLAKFNKDYRVVWPSFWQDHPYYPFEKKDKPDPDLFKTGIKE